MERGVFSGQNRHGICSALGDGHVQPCNKGGTGIQVAISCDSSDGPGVGINQKKLFLQKQSNITQQYVHRAMSAHYFGPCIVVRVGAQEKWRRVGSCLLVGLLHGGHPNLGIHLMEEFLVPSDGNNLSVNHVPFKGKSLVIPGHWRKAKASGELGKAMKKDNSTRVHLGIALWVMTDHQKGHRETRVGRGINLGRERHWLDDSSVGQGDVIGVHDHSVIPPVWVV